MSFGKDGRFASKADVFWLSKAQRRIASLRVRAESSGMQAELDVPGKEAVDYVLLGRGHLAHFQQEASSDGCAQSHSRTKFRRARQRQVVQARAVVLSPSKLSRPVPSQKRRGRLWLQRLLFLVSQKEGIISQLKHSPPLKRTMALRQAYSEWSILKMAHLASSSRRRLASSLRICFLSGDRWAGISCDSSTGKFHCAAVRTKSSHQDSSRSMAWSL